jgi:hypothetical protein
MADISNPLTLSYEMGVENPLPHFTKLTSSMGVFTRQDHFRVSVVLLGLEA